MYLSGFSSYDHMVEQFNIDSKDLEGVQILFAKYKQGDYCGQALVIYSKGEELYEVNASHCSCMGIEGQWSPELTTRQDLEYRFFNDNLVLPDICDDDSDYQALRRVLLDHIAEEYLLQ